MFAIIIANTAKHDCRPSRVIPIIANTLETNWVNDSKYARIASHTFDRGSYTS